MSHKTKKLFLDNPYQTKAPAHIVAVNARGGIIVDESIFYATSGGQPGDSGSIVLPDGTELIIATAVCGESKDEIILVPTAPQELPAPGTRIVLQINWPRRHKLMRMHTALHLLCACVPFPVTGGQIGEQESRLDFDMPETMDKHELGHALNQLVEGNHPVTSRWIADQELAIKPDLVRTMSVKPPMAPARCGWLPLAKRRKLICSPAAALMCAPPGKSAGWMSPK